MYIKLDNGKPIPYSIEHLRRDNPQTSFPSRISNELLSEWNVFPLKLTQQPTYDTVTQIVREETPIKIDDVWTQQWVIENKSEERIEKETYFEAIKIRNQRDELLTECDWIIIKSLESEVPKIDEWKSYRQELRDIPNQTGFPWNVIWPTKPE